MVLARPQIRQSARAILRLTGKAQRRQAAQHRARGIRHLADIPERIGVEILPSAADLLADTREEADGLRAAVLRQHLGQRGV